MCLKVTTQSILFMCRFTFGSMLTDQSCHSPLDRLSSFFLCSTTFLFSFSVISTNVCVSAAGFVLAFIFRWIYVFVVPGYQRQCYTMSAFRPFLTSEQKRQGPKNERERGRERGARDLTSDHIRPD